MSAYESSGFKLLNGLAVVLAASLFAACEPPLDPPANNLIVWQTRGSWSGRGVLQTNAFEIESGMLRLDWEARNEQPPATGTLHVSLYSAVSGRHLASVVDHRGVGRHTEYINEDPRGFYLVIESANVDWSVEVAEGIRATGR
jgi:hypothetical protein